MRKYINSRNINAQSDFPFLVLDVVNHHVHPVNPGFNVMHWHSDLQIIYVLAGRIQIITLDETREISAGEGVFINRNVVHRVRHDDSSHYQSFIFPAYFVEFYLGGPTQRLVEDLVLNQRLEIIVFNMAGKWSVVSCPC